MSAAVDTSLEVEVIEALDFEPVIGCEWLAEGEPHGAQASWWLRLSCCGAAQALCEEHKQDTERALRLAVAIGCSVQCGRCKAMQPSWSWIPVGGERS